MSLGSIKKVPAYTPGEICPIPTRGGVFDRNIKNGVKYADAKTKAR